MTPLQWPVGTPGKTGGDHPIVYAVEGTPMCFSRNSSLSSLDSNDQETSPLKKGRELFYWALLIWADRKEKWLAIPETINISIWR